MILNFEVKSIRQEACKFEKLEWAAGRYILSLFGPSRVGSISRTKSHKHRSYTLRQTLTEPSEAQILLGLYSNASPQTPTTPP